MAYDEKLADRVREFISLTHPITEEKRMFGGLCFMVNDKMCVGVESERLMLRVHPSLTDELLEKEGCQPMNFTGKTMKGFLFVDKSVLATKKQLSSWLQLALDYNPYARASARKKK